MNYQIKSGITRTRSKLLTFTIGMATLVFPSFMALAGGSAAAASSFSLSPWTYDPANACPGITSHWDNTTGNPAPSLYLNKPCLTATNASSGASVNGVSGITLTELNFQYNNSNGGHCGAGAPRYNVVTTDNVTHFFGCASGTQTDLGNGWTEVTWDVTNPAQAFPVITPGETVASIDVVFDEGTDQGTGFVNLDNFSINGQIIGGPATPASSSDCKNGGWKNLTDANGNAFKNQGQCVSYAEHHNGHGQDDVHVQF